MIYEMIRNTVGDYAGNINAEAVIKKRYNEDLRKEVCAVKDRRIILVTGFRNNCIYDAQLLTWLASYTEIQLKEGASRLINFRFEGTILMFAEQIPEFSQYDNNFLRN
jgi:hypothetical protein